MTAAGDTRADLLAQLGDTWEATTGLLAGLDAAGWDTPTDLPGWRVHDVVAHLIGTESMLAGRDAPDGGGRAWPAHVHNDIGALNEAWVEARRDRSPPAMLAEWRSVTGERLAALAAMGEEELDAPSWTPVGNASYRRFIQIRVFDCWVHEQDIRRAVGRPGGAGGPAAAASVDEVERALGYLVGKKAGAAAGSRITFELTGPAGRQVHVAVGDRAAVVAGLDRPPDVTVRLDAVDFVARACGRAGADQTAVSYAGDRVLGETVAAHLAFTV